MRAFLSSLGVNFALITAMVSLVSAQTIKQIYYYFKERELNLNHILEAGGMPSAHAAMSCGLTTTLGLLEGWFSPLFALGVVFTFIVMYDAAGVRRATGKQALILNKIVEDIYATGKISEKKLSELMGHTPLEVLVGALLGITIALLLYRIY